MLNASDTFEKPPQFLYNNYKHLAMECAAAHDYQDILKFLYNNYKHLVTKVEQNTYEKLLPFIQEDFRKKFEKIEKENIVREFLAKKLVYHPSSCYMKRIVEKF